jgi:hypothetical protein
VVCDIVGDEEIFGQELVVMEGQAREFKNTKLSKDLKRLRKLYARMIICY